MLFSDYFSSLCNSIAIYLIDLISYFTESQNNLHYSNSVIVGTDITVVLNNKFKRDFLSLNIK